MPTGYGGIGALLVFYYNTPNTTLPIVWSSLNGWIPLFRRVNRINGIEAYYKQIPKLKPEAKENVVENEELIIYTEGKIDENVFDILVNDFDLEKKLNYNKISVVSLGGGFQSKKLFEKLKELNGNMLFVFDEDVQTRSRKEYMNELPVVYLKPSYLQFIDLMKFMDDDYRFQSFIQRRNIDIRNIDKITYGNKAIVDIDTRELERYLRNRLMKANSNLVIREMLNSFFSNSGYQQFLSDANAVLSKN